MIIKRKNMDRYKISYKCNKQPETSTGLSGFEPHKSYTGRAYNGFFEISSEWGRGKPTMLLDKKSFEQYFELIKNNPN